MNEEWHKIKKPYLNPDLSIFMSDKSENCPVCLKKMKEHTVLDMVNCSEKLIKENKDDSNQTSFDKNQEALKLINGLLELSQKDLEEYEKKDPDDLTIKVILQYQPYFQDLSTKQKELLEKLRDILV